MLFRKEYLINENFPLLVYFAFSLADPNTVMVIVTHNSEDQVLNGFQKRFYELNPGPPLGSGQVYQT